MAIKIEHEKLVRDAVTLSKVQEFLTDFRGHDGLSKEELERLFQIANHHYE